MARSMSRSSRVMHTFGRAAGYTAVGGVAALAATTVSAVKTTLTFERAMRNVNSIAGLSERQFKSLSDGVLKMASEVGQTPQTLAEGLYDLVSSGFDASESMKILKHTSKAATAGLTDTATSTKAVAAVLNAYRLPVKKAEEVTDTLFRTVDRGVITFEELSSNIGEVLPYSAAMGISLKEVGASIATMTKQGLSGANATTFIKNAMVAMLSPSKEAKEAIKSLGVESGEQLVKQKGFQGALEAMVGTTDGTKSAVQKLFPNIRALNTLLALTGKNSDAARRDLAGFKDVTGATDAVFKEQSKSAAMAGQKLKAAWDVAKITMGAAMMPILAREAAKLVKTLGEASQNGSLAKFGEDLANGVGDAIEVIGDLVGMMQLMWGAAQPVVSAVQGIAGALSFIPGEAVAGSLMGIATSMLMFRGMTAVAPAIMATTSAITQMAAAMRAAQFTNAAMIGASGPMGATTVAKQSVAAAGARSLGASVAGVGAAMGPIGAIAIAAGLGFTAYSIAQGRAKEAARDAADAINAGKEAMQQSGDVARQAAQDVVRAEMDKAQLMDLTDERDKARKRGEKDRVKDLNQQIKQGKLTADESAKRAKQGVENAPKDDQKQLGEKLKEVNVLNKAYWKSLKEVSAEEAHLGHLREINAGPSVIAKQQKLIDQKRKEADASRKLYNEAKREEAQLKALRDLGDLTKQRAKAGRSDIGYEHAQGIQRLQQAMKNVPKEVRTKMLVEGDPKSLSKLGNMTDKLKGIVPKAKIEAILTGDGTVRQKLAALAREAGKRERKVIEAILTGDGSAREKLSMLRSLNVKDKRFAAILNGAGSAEAKIRQLQAMRIPDKTFNITAHGGGSKKRARGRSSGAGENALVGEQHPREAVINARTGDGYFTDGPMFASLAPEDYVIPTDSRFRGRALGLFGSLARDLGIPGFKRGKKGKGKGKAKEPSFPVPKKYKKIALSRPLDDMENKLSSARQRMKSAKKGSKKRKAAAEDVRTWQRRVKEARKFDRSIKRQEDLLEIAEKDMTLGAKRRDRGLYNKGRDARKSSLARLRDWFKQAVDVAPNTAWGRELKKKLGDTLISIEEGGPKFKDEVVNVDDFITDDEQKRLDDLDAALAQAELTTGTIDDDRSALTQIKDVWESIYGRGLSSGAPSPVIAELARSVKGARDNLANLSTSAAPDLQAQLDQANARKDAAAKDAAANAAALKAFGGAGDIGSGGRNAYRAAGGPTININTLSPADPATLKHIAGAATAGVDAQGYIPNKRVTTGV